MRVEKKTETVTTEIYAIVMTKEEALDLYDNLLRSEPIYPSLDDLITHLSGVLHE